MRYQKEQYFTVYKILQRVYQKISFNFNNRPSNIRQVHFQYHDKINFSFAQCKPNQIAISVANIGCEIISLFNLNLWQTVLLSSKINAKKQFDQLHQQRKFLTSLRLFSAFDRVIWSSSWWAFSWVLHEKKNIISITSLMIYHSCPKPPSISNTVLTLTLSLRSLLKPHSS